MIMIVIKSKVCVCVCVLEENKVNEHLFLVVNKNLNAMNH